MSIQDDFKRIHDLYGHTLDEETLSWGHLMDKFGRSIRGHDFYIHSLCINTQD